MLGAPCCSRWGPLGLDGDDLGLHFGALGLIWVTAWKALGGMWTPLGQTGCSNELFGTPVRREHQLEGPGGPKGSMWGLEVCHPEKACAGQL